jgi:uncharacterized lipoprotein YmbA
MKTGWQRIRILLTVLVGVWLTGCSGLLKPSGIEARYFVLAPLPDNASPPATTGAGVGLGVIKMPDYLLDRAMICRKGTNEISRVAAARWAERLDQGLQRVLAANLVALLPGNHVRLSAWRAGDVRVEVHVGVSQFDVDETGRGVLAAEWRIQKPGTGEVLQTGQFKDERKGASPEQDPQKAVAALNELVGELSTAIANAIKALPR